MVRLNKGGKKTISFTNPVGNITNIGDPFVLKVKNTYYMYATSDPNNGFKVWQSPNLVDWCEKGYAYHKQDQKEEWGTSSFWAPEVIAYRHQYFMVFSARNKDGHLQISIAKSDSPLGPFINYSTDIIKQPGSYIDGHLFKDDDGRIYLYYVKDCSENIINGKHVSQIYVQEMNKELTKTMGEAKLLLQPDQNWEGLEEEYQWNEGPFVIKKNFTYYLMYSANYFGSPNYAIGYATSDNPFGPFKKAEENPILAKNLKRGISGPGHNSVTIGPDDETLYIVYHTHTFPDQPSGNRQMNIDKLNFHNDKLYVEIPPNDEREITLGS